MNRKLKTEFTWSLKNLLQNISCFLLLIFSHYSFAQDDARLKRLELEYLLFNTNDSINKAELNIQIAECFKNEGNYHSAIVNLNLAEKIMIDPRLADRIYYLKAISFFMLDSNEQSLINLKKIDVSKIQPEEKNIHTLTILNLNHLSQLDSSKQVLLQACAYYKLDTNNISHTYAEAKSTEYYKLKNAARLSRILPGAGLFYVDEQGKALTSLGLNLFFIGYTAYSIYTGYYITATLTGGLQFLRFYNGGKKASIRTAFLKNQIIKDEAIRDLNNFCLEKLNMKTPE